MPESDFALHKDIIEIWADFVEFREKLEMMMNILYLGISSGRVIIMI